MKIWLVSDYTHYDNENTHRAFYTRCDAMKYLKSLLKSDSEVVSEYISYVKKTVPEPHLEFYDWIDKMCGEGEFYLWDYSIRQVEVLASESI